MFKDIVEDDFFNLKCRKLLPDFKIVSLDDGSFLKPLTDVDIDNEFIVNALSVWRTKLTTFPNKFTATFQGTQTWLKNLVLKVPDRILFLLFSSDDELIGHMGFANISEDNKSIEIDNVVRGVKFKNPGVMKSSLLKMMEWFSEKHNPRFYNLRTLKTNTHAIESYSEPLKKIFTEDGYHHVSFNDDSAPPDNYYVHMKLSF